MKYKPFFLKLALPLTILLVVLVGGWYIKSQTFTQLMADLAAQKAGQILATDIKIGAVHIESFNSIRIDDVVLYDAKGAPLLQAQTALVHFSPLAIWQTGSPVKAVDRVAVDSPNVFLAQRPDGTWNYNDILPEQQKESVDFSGRIEVENGHVTALVKGQELSLDDLDAMVDFAHYPSLQLKASFKHGDAEFEISGIAGGNRQALSLDGENIDLTKYLDFIPKNMLGDVTIKSGVIKKVKATFMQNETDGLKIDGQAELENGGAVFMGKTASDIEALLVFNEKEVQIFSRATLEDQPITIHGKLRFDTGPMFMNLVAQSTAFDPTRILDGIPYQGLVAFTANISGTLDNPTVEGDFSVKSGEVYGYAFQNAKAKLKYSQNVLFVDKLTAEIFGGTIDANGQLVTPTLNYNFNVKADNLDAAAFSGFLPDLEGRISADVAIAGQGLDLTQAQIYGSGTISAGSYRSIAFQGANVSFSKNGSLITIDSLSANMLGGGALSLDGTIDGDAIELGFQGVNVDLSLLTQINASADASGLADFNGRVRGSKENPEVRVDFSAVNGHLFGQPYHQLRGSGAGSLNGVYIHDFTMENGGKITHTASGIIGFSGERRIDLNVETRGARMEDLKLLLMADQPITGNVDNSVHLTGTLDNIEAQGHIHFYEGSYRGVLLTGADGYYQRKNGITQLTDFDIESPLIKLKLSGTMDSGENLDFSVKADDIQLEKLQMHLPYPISGIAKFSGKVQGTFDSPIFNGALQSDEMQLNGQKIEKASGTLTYKDSTIGLQNFGFSQNDGTYALDEHLNIQTHAVTGRLQVKNADVNAILAVANYKNDTITGRLDGTIDLGGTIENPTASVEGFIASGTLKGYPLSKITIDATLNNHVVTLHKFYGEQGLGKLAAEGTVDLNGPINARMSAQDIDAGLLTHLFDSKIDMKGQLNVDAQFGGTIQNPEADVSIDVEHGGVGSAVFDSMTGLMNLKNGTITVNQLLLKKGPYKATAYGIIPLKAIGSKPWEMPDDYEQIKLKVSLDQADLSILPMLSDQVDWAIGPLAGGVTITGTLAHPFINGSVKTMNGAMKLKALKNPVQNIQMDIDFQNEKMTVNKFTGNMGGGSYSLTGSTLITGGGFDLYNFNLNLDKLGIDSDFYQGPISGDFTLTTGEIFGHKMPKLSGNLLIEKATITIPSLPDTQSELPNMIIDIGLNLGDKVRLYSSFLYDLSLKGSAHFGGVTHHPQPSGEISVIRGTVSYLKTVFKVREGSAYFNQVDSFLPTVHLEADTKLNRTKIYLGVDGPASNMAIKLSSDSDMSQNELLQLLTLRSSYQSGASTDSSQLSELLDVSLRMSFLSEVDTIVRNALQVDEFNIVRDTLSSTEASNSSKSDKEVYNVEIGKYLSDKFMLKYIKGIGYDKNKLGLQYDLNDRISLTSTFATDNEYTVGVEARLKF